MSLGVTTFAELEALVADYLEFDEFVIDIESMGEHRLDPQRNEVFWVSLAGPGRADAVPCGHPIGERVIYDEDDEAHRITKTGKYQEHRINETTGRLKWFDLPAQFTPAPKQLWISDVIEALRPLLFSDRRKIGHNVKFDLRSLAKYYGEIPPGPYGDTEIASRLVNENHLSYRLGDCISRAFHFKYEKIGKAVETYPYSEAYQYSYYDSKFDWLLWRWCVRGMKREHVRHIFDFEMSLMPVIIDMEQTGVAIDEAALAALGDEFLLELAELQLSINEAAGREVNLNANEQVANLVYDIRGHKCYDFTPTEKRKTSKDVLEKYKKDPIVANILEYSAVNKLQGSFVEGIQKRTVEGAVHPTFKQAGTVSGRASCTEPNVQQVPSRSERGKRVRDVFVARPKQVLVVSDLSQIELRVLAHFTRDPKLLQAYRQGLDLHSITAAAVFGEDFSPEQRSLAKNGNFSIVFGASPGTLVRKYGFPSEKIARQILDGFYRSYRRVKPWRESVLEQAWQRSTKTPYVETVLGRKRRLPQLFSLEVGLRMGAERQAISTVIQGSAADLFKVAMMNCSQRLGEVSWKGHILMVVHDELVVEVPEKYGDEGLTLVKQSMEEILNPFSNEPILSVPIVADAKIVKRWSEGK